MAKSQALAHVTWGSCRMGHSATGLTPPVDPVAAWDPALPPGRECRAVSPPPRCEAAPLTFSRDDGSGRGLGPFIVTYDSAAVPITVNDGTSIYQATRGLS